MGKSLNTRLINDFVDSKYIGQDRIPARICHYTSPQTVPLVLREDSIVFRFTRWDCVNDISEGRMAIECYEYVCRELFAEEKLSADYHDALVQITNDVYMRALPLGNPQLASIPERALDSSEKYICCFSMDPDSLPMWNYYIKDRKCEGYCIEITPQNTRIAYKNGLSHEIYFASVLYGIERINGLLSRFILKYANSYLRGTDAQKSDILFCIRNYLDSIKLLAKMDCFTHEREIRAILPLQPTDKGKFPISFSWANGFSAPYIDMSFDKDIFCRIGIGPLMDHSVALQTTKEFLESTRYPSKLRVFASRIPIRF